MATEGIKPEDLNNLSGSAENLREGFKNASLGAFTLTEETTGLLGVLQELGSTLDFITRNPLVSFTFFEKIGRSLQKEIIQHLREVKNLTDAQVASWNKWASVINFTTSSLLSFTTKVAYLQSQLRAGTIDLSRYFNLNALPYGAPFETVYQVQRMRALQTLQLNADFAKANAEIKQMLGRLITPEQISSVTGMRGLMAKEVYENFMKQITLYSRAYPEANIPRLAGRLYEEYGGFGMTPLAAINAAMYFSRMAAYGRMIPTADVGENMNILLRTAELYKSRGLGVKSFEMAQASILGLSQVRGAGGEPLPLTLITELLSMYPGRAPEQEILMRALGVPLTQRAQYLGTYGPLFTIQALQKWAKSKGLAGMPGSEVQDIVTRELGSKMGRSYQELITLAQLPDITFKVQDIEKVVKSINSLNTEQVNSLKNFIQGIPDRHARELEQREKRARKLPDVIGGFLDWISTQAAGKAEDLGISPLLLQSIIGGLVSGALAYTGIKGIKKLKGIAGALTKSGGLRDIILGGKVAGEVAEGVGGKVAGEVAEEVATKVGTKLGLGALGKTVSKFFGPIGAILAVYDIVDLLVDSINRQSELTQAEREYKKIEEVSKGIGTTPGKFFRSPQGFKSLSKYMTTPSVSDATGVSLGKELSKLDTTREDALSALKDKSSSGTLNVIFSTSSGINLGETIAEIGKETFININIGAIINSMSGRS